MLECQNVTENYDFFNKKLHKFFSIILNAFSISWFCYHRLTSHAIARTSNQSHLNSIFHLIHLPPLQLTRHSPPIGVHWLDCDQNLLLALPVLVPEVVLPVNFHHLGGRHRRFLRCAAPISDRPIATTLSFPTADFTKAADSTAAAAAIVRHRHRVVEQLLLEGTNWEVLRQQNVPARVVKVAPGQLQRLEAGVHRDVQVGDFRLVHAITWSERVKEVTEWILLTTLKLLFK